METNLAELLEALSDPAAAFDDEGVLIYSNTSARLLLGYGPDEDLSQSILSDSRSQSTSVFSGKPTRQRFTKEPGTAG